MKIIKAVVNRRGSPKLVGLVAIVCLLAIFCGGCAASTSRAKKDSIAYVRFLYDTEAYYRCLDQIETKLKNHPNAYERAALLLLKGMCQEELKLYDAANESYRLLMKEYAHTSAADEAELRINRKFGDQREHLDLNVTNLGWKRIGIRADAQMCEKRFYLEKEGLKNLRTILILHSADRPENIVVLDQFLERMTANAKLHTTECTWKILEKSESEACVESSYTELKGNKKCYSLTRVVWGQRVHGIEVRTLKPDLTESERQDYLNLLRSALIEGAE